MFPTEVLAAYLVAALIVVVAPGSDNILAISRGLGQGRAAAAMSSLGASLGIMVHTIAATLGVALVLQASPLAFAGGGNFPSRSNQCQDDRRCAAP